MEPQRVLLLGDLVRLTYQPAVARLLAGVDDLEVEVVGPAESTGDSAQLAASIRDYLDKFNPTIVQFNAGLEDVRWHRREGRSHIPIAEYEMNLQRIVDACTARLGNDVIFAATTPVIDAKQCDRPDSEYDRCNRDLEEYNIAAREIMLGDDILINPLDRVIAERDDEYLADDGVSLTDAGAEAAARSTVACLHALWHL